MDEFSTLLANSVLFLRHNPLIDQTDRTNSSFPGLEAVTFEINAKYHFLRHVSDFGHF